MTEPSRLSLVIVSRSMPPDIGGYQRQVGILLPHLRRRFFDTTWIGATRDRNRGTAPASTDGVRLVRVPASGFPRRVRGLSDFAVCGLAVAAMARARRRHEDGVMLLLSPTMLGGPFVVAVARLVGWRVSVRYPSRGDQLHRRGRRVGRMGSGPHIVPSPGQVGEQDAFGVVHVANAVCRTGDPERSPSAEVGRFLFIGRLVQSKRPEAVLRAWGQIAARLPGWSVEFIGDGGEQRGSVEAELRQLVGSGGFPRCRLSGAQPDAAVALARADIMVFPSLTEGLPNAVLEAMAAGVPVIADPVRAREWFGREVPLLAWDGHEESLGIAMFEAALSVAKRAEVAAEGRRFVALHHDPQEVARRLATVLTGCHAPGST